MMAADAIDSHIDPTSKIYRNVRLVRCSIGEGCVVGDDTDAVGLFMAARGEVGRRTQARNTRMGVGSYSGTNCVIKNAEIGNYCCIGWDVSIGGGQHDYANVGMYTDYWYERVFGKRFEGSNEKALPVVVGSDVWIGAGAIVNGGVEIGTGAVVGAGSVVTRDVPPYAIVVGAPARIMKYRFDEDMILRLLKTEWWNIPYDILKEHLDLIRSRPDEVKLSRLESLREIERQGVRS